MNRLTPSVMPQFSERCLCAEYSPFLTSDYAPLGTASNQYALKAFLCLAWKAFKLQTLQFDFCGDYAARFPVTLELH